MNLNSLQKRGSGFLLGLALVLSLLTAVRFEAKADNNNPDLPVLSLTGTLSDYAEDAYPDGRIWLPPSTGSNYREFLLPVFINNNWVSTELSSVQAYPIYSFKFHLVYDSTVFRAVGYEKSINKNVSNDPCVANDFQIDFNDVQDHSWQLLKSRCPSISDKLDGTWTGYWSVLTNACHSPEDLKKGRRVTIAGASSKPLPKTSSYQVLVYVRFQVLTQNNAMSPIIIDNREIAYNDVNIRKENPLNLDPSKNKLGVYNIHVGNPYSTPGWSPDGIALGFEGIGGADNSQNVIWATESSLKGMVWVRVTSSIPAFDMECNRGSKFINNQIKNVDNKFENWTLVDALTVDSAATKVTGMKNNYSYATRRVTLRNRISGTRMLDIKIESDQPYFTFRLLDPQDMSPKTSWLTTSDQIPFDSRIRGIDNGILGNPSIPDILGQGTENVKYRDIIIEVKFDKDKITNADKLNNTAIYKGCFSVTSPYAEKSTVKLNVTGILFKDPNEGKSSKVPGARIWVRNAKSATVDDTCMLVFGTGSRATAGIDTLFGEFDYPATPAFDNMQTLTARWFVPEAPNGLGDWLPDDESNFSSSRDIRNELDTMQSLIYKCRVKRNPGNANLIIEWDPRDLISGSRCFLRDINNGKDVNIDMVNGGTTLLNGKHSYTSTDLSFNSFNVEYTPPRIVKYFDNDQNPIIKTGWNLLSLPVRPTSSLYSDIYVHAVGIPYEFNGVGFQVANNLVVGKGYFTKYADVLDNQYTGAILSKIDNSDNIVVYPGTASNPEAWNIVGGISFPVSIKYIKFTPYMVNGQPQTADIDFSLRNGVWGYKTGKGYYQTTEITPGLGYFIKVNNYSYYNLIPPVDAIPTGNRIGEEATAFEVISASSTPVFVRDIAQNGTEVYMSNDKSINTNELTMPPVSGEMFDVRFANNSYVSNSNSSIIKLNGVTFPVTVSMNNADAKYTFVDANTKEVLGTIAKGTSASINVKSLRGSEIEVLKSETSSVTVTPNPASDFIKVVSDYSGAIVTLFDEMGNQIQTLTADNNGIAQFDAKNLSSGKYICRIVNGDKTETVSVTVVR